MSGTLGLIISHLLPSTLGEEVLVGEVKELLTSDAGKPTKSISVPCKLSELHSSYTRRRDKHKC